MRVGVDGRKIPRATEYGPVKSLDHARQLGMEGLFFRSVLDMSPTLDHGELREIKCHADELGMYVESGLGKVNPYASAEAPELRAAGDGDILLGFRRMLEASRAIDVTEVWIGTANFKGQYYGYWCYDRFRTDVTWEEQLAATERFLKKLAPIARDLGIHMNIETHEEITTFEVVRLVEAVGPDAIGITFDTGNVTHRGEAPVAAARRIAPYVRQTHLKDVVHVFADDGLKRQVRPCGHGLVDFEVILPLLHHHNPKLNLSIENPTANGEMIVQIYDPVWQASHPDLSVSELAELIRLTRMCEERIASGAAPTLDAYDEVPFDYDRSVWFIKESAAYLRGVCDRRQLV
ncbi:MAG: sugar phosphate isomerase/epimerase [Chloroflexi bacterium]|nr:sugar phosphate isomerase/epimerase [Chloroflexota bacterium]